MKCLSIVAVMMLTSSPVFAQDCLINRGYISFGADTDTSMVVKSGAACTGVINAALGVQSSTVAQNASNGAVSISDNHHWTYRSRPGFKGQDAFVIQITGTGFGPKRASAVREGTTKINVAVHVQ